LLLLQSGGGGDAANLRAAILRIPAVAAPPAVSQSFVGYRILEQLQQFLLPESQPELEQPAHSLVAALASAGGDDHDP
jgi:hypothetical protein